MQGHSDCFLLGRGCWLVAHLLLHCFDSRQQQKCHQLWPGCFCALRKVPWLTESSLRNNIKAGTNKAAGSVQLARASSCGSSPHVMTLLLTQCWWQGMAEESRCSHTSLICLFCLGVDKANGLPFNSTIFCFVVGT